MSDAKPQYRAWFQSLEHEDERYGLDEVVYTDSDGGLLQVVHDKDELAKTSAAEWKALFEERAHKTEWPLGSGVWGKKEWVCPEVQPANVVSMYEGHTNLFWANRYGSQVGLDDLWLKLCGNSHTGSFKDLGMTVLVSMVKEMISRGKPIRAVACASTGDTSAALSAYAAAAGIPAIVFLPRGKISLAQLIQPVANGAIVFALDTDFDGCMEIVKQVAQKDGIYLANSMNSLRVEGQKTVGIEIVQQFDWEVPDWIIIPGGNLGNVSALAKGLDLMHDLGMITTRPRLVVAQAENANPLYLSYKRGFEVFEPIHARPTLASAIQIGAPVSFRKAIAALKRYDGIVEQASEAELVEAAMQADRTGLFNCPHTGVALAAMQKLVKRGEIHKRDRVVVISTAHGLKFTDFKARYHNMELDGIIPEMPNPPIELVADYAVVRERMLREIDTRFPHLARPEDCTVFTGIIEAVGKIASVEGRGEVVRFAIEAPEITEGVRIGDSVAVSGACLTVVEATPAALTFEAIRETLLRTSLGGLATGSRVNLERAMRADSRLDGHIVQGHVDGLGRVAKLEREGDDVRLYVDCEADFAGLLVEKGSVAIDGVSLTVVDVREDGFDTALIPHTLAVTTLGERRPGDPLNLEADVLGKYKKYLERVVGKAE